MQISQIKPWALAFAIVLGLIAQGHQADIAQALAAAG
jgi:hypothetical protein